MCGIVGMIGCAEVEELLFDALRILQHRGQQGAGVLFSDGSSFIEPAPHRTLGWVDDCQDTWPFGRTGIVLGTGQTRYATTGQRVSIADAQPMLIESPYGPFSIAHNGDTPGYAPIKEKLGREGSVFHSTSDTEVLAQLIARESAENLKGAARQALSQIQGAFSLILATPSGIIGCRDPWGYRPLSLGRLGPGYILASESIAFDAIGAKFERDIEPGELIWIEQGQEPESCSIGRAQALQRCAFEMIYFSRPDSVLWGSPLDRVREALGAKLAEECGLPDHPDIIIIEVPDSAKFAARGYAERLGRSVDPVLIRTHYERRPRTFTTVGDEARADGVRRKFNPIHHRIQGKWCVLIDDSLVRGTTMRRLVRMLRRNGATGVTVLIASPPIMFPCRYGIDMKSPEELLAASEQGDVESIKRIIGADELYYLSYKGLKEVLGPDMCYACFDGKYAF